MRLHKTIIIFKYSLNSRQCSRSMEDLRIKISHFISTIIFFLTFGNLYLNFNKKKRIQSGRYTHIFLFSFYMIYFSPKQCTIKERGI